MKNMIIKTIRAFVDKKDKLNDQYPLWLYPTVENQWGCRYCGQAADVPADILHDTDCPIFMSKFLIPRLEVLPPDELEAKLTTMLNQLQAISRSWNDIAGITAEISRILGEIGYDVG